MVFAAKMNDTMTWGSEDLGPGLKPHGRETCTAKNAQKSLQRSAEDVRMRFLKTDARGARQTYFAPPISSRSSGPKPQKHRFPINDQTLPRTLPNPLTLSNLPPPNPL